MSSTATDLSEPRLGHATFPPQHHLARRGPGGQLVPHKLAERLVRLAGVVQLRLGHRVEEPLELRRLGVAADRRLRPPTSPRLDDLREPGAVEHLLGRAAVAQLVEAQLGQAQALSRLPEEVHGEGLVHREHEVVGSEALAQLRDERAIHRPVHDDGVVHRARLRDLLRRCRTVRLRREVDRPVAQGTRARAGRRNCFRFSDRTSPGRQ